MEVPRSNVDPSTVRAFGFEWTRFDQSDLPADEMQRYFDAYFSIFPWDQLPPNAIGIDIGCGSGRWAAAVAPRVGKLYCLDASAEALDVARRRLSTQTNCEFVCASVGHMGLEPASLDFAYSLGVLHHIPDTLDGLKKCVALLKPGAPFLVYLYYALDGRSFAYRAIWNASNVVRGVVSRLPANVRAVVTDAIAVGVYWPLSRFARLVEISSVPYGWIPLSYYRNSSFFTLRTDALDRFGTPLERRFSRDQIERMMRDAGLVDTSFRDGAPFWCAVGYRA